MGKSRTIGSNDEEPPKRRGRQAGAKSYNQQTLYKLIVEYKPRNMVLWATVAEQYRIACGELKAREPSVLKKHFFHKMCNQMKKPTGSSGVDDFTAKCQSLHRSLFSMEEGTTFGDDSDEEDQFNHLGGDVSDDSSDTTEMEIFDATQSSKSLNTPISVDVSHTLHQQVMSTSSVSSRPIVKALDGLPVDTKSKNAKHNPTSRLNVGKYFIFL